VLYVEWLNGKYRKWEVELNGGQRGAASITWTGTRECECPADLCKVRRKIQFLLADWSGLPCPGAGPVMETNEYSRSLASPSDAKDTARACPCVAVFGDSQIGKKKRPDAFSSRSPEMRKRLGPLGAIFLAEQPLWFATLRIGPRSQKTGKRSCACFLRNAGTGVHAEAMPFGSHAPLPLKRRRRANKLQLISSLLMSSKLPS